jgi:hypothetical protein
MKTLLAILLASQLSALSVFNITTANITGLSIPKNSIIILTGFGRELLHTTVGKQLVKHTVKVYTCPDKACSEVVINYYKDRYRTNGISLINW